MHACTYSYPITRSCQEHFVNPKAQFKYIHSEDIKHLALQYKQPIMITIVSLHVKHNHFIV